MVMQPCAWMIACLLSTWISHFIVVVQAHRSNIFLKHKHSLILGGHYSHVTINFVQTTRKVGLNLIILPSHTSHTLQLLHVYSFKSFKTAFQHTEMFRHYQTKGKL
jgi:hypothetical protein